MSEKTNKMIMNNLRAKWKFCNKKIAFCVLLIPVLIINNQKKQLSFVFLSVVDFKPFR